MNTDYTEQIAQDFITVKKKYDSLSQAIKLARLAQVDESLVNHLILMKQEVNQDRTAIENNIQRKMSKDTNISRIYEQWYAIKYINDKNETVIKVDLIRDKDISIVQRNPKKHGCFRRAELEVMLSGIIDDELLEVYKQELIAMAKEHLHDLGVDIITPTIEAPVRDISFSSHTRKRYAQRVLGIRGDNEAQEYQRVHIAEIEEALLERYNNSELIWTGPDSIEYWFDADNYMYVVGNATVITMYEEDFGFTRDINRGIVYQQIEVVKQALTELREAELHHDATISMSNDEAQNIDSEIALLKAQIDELEARKTTVQAEKTELTKGLRVRQERFNKESDKLFKKWDV